MSYLVNLIDRCLKCSACLEVCPVVQHTKIFPGPKYAGPEVARLLRPGMVEDTVDWCLNCKRCELKCPNGVEITQLIIKVKEASVKAKNHYWRDLILGYPHLSGFWGTAFAGLANTLLTSRLGKKLLDKVLAISPERPFPHYSRQSFLHWSRSLKSLNKEKVAYFVGCYANYYEPSIGKALVNLMELLGISVIVPQQVCCGIPLLTNGFRAQAHRLFRKNIENLLPLVQAGFKVICTCPTCGLAFKKVYLDELGTQEAELVAKATYDYAEYLEAYSSRLHHFLHPLPQRLAYHTPCHTMAQGIGTPSYSLVSLIPGLKVKLIDSGCCGLSGTFGFKKEKHYLSMAIGNSLFNAIGQLAPEGVVTDCGSCAMQISFGTGQRVQHPLMIIWGSVQKKN
ncbi:glycerol 3-phosphate dehydrogenase (quinone) subunit C [Thermanaeromonas toyohensis ToBE]|uniref:Glycerol 3-phosphate dehydrogenase (Quinone) subunit C n=1 Tax=Thermanaeromonas toyohensis ToBE TaxID=698762 RepID=A0A1W1VXR5_9FIRM|nr:anaerobic glycerol-3-phosphate dehydrogenase subunit C [Thermanaeromonas toyohensis]SMB98179.1 glycerol 3-phosphate dehydrogenase (quinone) subunit C [Thermanaeromonas toyohensis ToBE]